MKKTCKYCGREENHSESTWSGDFCTDSCRKSYLNWLIREYRTYSR
jgi:hypothetical protein